MRRINLEQAEILIVHVHIKRDIESAQTKHKITAMGLLFLSESFYMINKTHTLRVLQWLKINLSPIERWRDLNPFRILSHCIYTEIIDLI